MPSKIKNIEKDIIEAFVKRQEAEFGYSMPRGFVDVEVVNLRVSALGKIPIVRPVEILKKKGTAREAFVGKREVYFKEGFIKTSIYDRSRLLLGARIKGPAIVEESNSTTVIPPGASAVVDQYGSIIIEV
jgi:N-methylhydantoinase A